MIKTKRVYDEPARGDGYRLLVMRIWPRGVRKDAVDGWEKDLGPSRDLLRAFRAGDVSWREFARRYRRELKDRRKLVEDVAERARRRTVTLLCGCEEASRCHRTVLKEICERAVRR